MYNSKFNVKVSFCMRRSINSVWRIPIKCNNRSPIKCWPPLEGETEVTSEGYLQNSQRTVQYQSLYCPQNSTSKAMTIV